MGAEQTRSRENTRARLLEAAAEVFAEVGIAGASVEAICDRAGFTRGAFYSNFETKDQLFLELSAAAGSRQLERVRSRIAQVESETEPSDGRDIRSLLRVLDTLGASRDDTILSVESELRAMRDSEFGAALIAQYERFVDEVTAIVEQVLRNRHIELRVDAGFAARVLMTTWDSTARNGVIAGLPEEERNRASHEAVARMAEALIA
ncbi:TetR/AcrR family transcriptional regulator [Microbacterium halophytorum]|uniref:TetR/AcrR family transcriptional regulator n=1 Tax=Microbacterium halophytorum TaxID=2067568 RepID=UPI001E458ABE|nr:TetR/AcrR family transcriptional regulator [Microbacterium halophytorum]